MDTYITMSQKEVKKYDIIKKLINKELNGTEAAGILGLTVRHVRRLKKRVSMAGIKGLIHGSRGREGNRRIPDNEKEKIKKLLHDKYSDFGPTLATEKLGKIHGIRRDPKTICTIQIEEGLWTKKNKKKETHRKWRQRRASCGEMLQYDGSYEYWFENRGEKCCLLACIDDANSLVWAKFDEHEGVVPTFNFWREYTERFGKPYSIYVDKFSTYSMNHKLAKENPDTLTQFQRAMEKDLNIEIIHAGSAQAKGRVEKLFRTLQDRLIKELRLKNISTIAKANKFLEEEYLLEFNTKFMVKPRSKANLHKELTKQEISRLDSIFSRQIERTVRNDFTINHNKGYYQLVKHQPVTICKGDKVIAEDRTDKTTHFRFRGKYLNYELLPKKPEKMNSKKSRLNWVIPKSKTPIPPAAHPWRQTVNLGYSKKLTKVSK